MKNTIGNNIKTLRLFLGRTLEEFATPIGLDTSHLSRIENGSRSASSELVQKICEKYGIAVSRIYATDFLGILRKDIADRHTDNKA